MSVTTADKINIDSITAKPPKTFGKAKLVFLEPRTKIVTPKMNPAWNIRPMSEDSSEDKFSLECRVEDEDSFKTAINNFDMKVRNIAYQNKKTWFGKASDDITTEADLRTMQSLSIKKGSEKIDGSRYPDTVKFKVTGWRDYAEKTIFKGEGDKKWPVDVEWRSRIVDSRGLGGPEDNQTKFYLCENTDMTTGREQMVPWTPCQDPAGNHIKDSQGNTVYEFVGPKHCQPGCKIRVVFEATTVWIAAKFGVTLAAKQVFITPAPAKSKSVVDGIEIKDFVDPILTAKAARAAMSSDLDDLDVPDNVSEEKSDEGTLGDLKFDDKTDKTEKPPKAEKTKAEKSESPKKKKAKNVDEDF